MIRHSFEFPDADMPRTVFYDRVTDTLRKLSGYTEDRASADILFPLEDTSGETNWPRYARPETAFIRGSFEPEKHDRYLDRLVLTNRPLCVINMHPFIRVPMRMVLNQNVIIADINLLACERLINPRTISMPALPITAGSFEPGAKRILAGFRGVESHPCRRALAELHNGTSIVVELVDRTNHFGKLDAESQIADPAYVELLNSTIFAFVPRGDAEFSYRLLEVMSFGCIPIILSDGLVLPFDRSIPWYEFSLHLPQGRIGEIPKLLAQISPNRVAAMQRTTVKVYFEFFAEMNRIMETLLSEVVKILH